MKTLHCVLKKEWFEKIKSGEKTHEYREVGDYWHTRIFSMLTANSHNKKKERFFSLTPFTDEVLFSLGMTSEPDKVMLFKIKSITIVDGKNTDLAIDKPVYDIELGERIE
jgi:hypothetical protein